MPFLALSPPQEKGHRKEKKPIQRDTPPPEAAQKLPPGQHDRTPAARGKAFFPGQVSDAPILRCQLWQGNQIDESPAPGSHGSNSTRNRPQVGCLRSVQLLNATAKSLAHAHACEGRGISRIPEGLRKGESHNPVQRLKQGLEGNGKPRLALPGAGPLKVGDVCSDPNGA